MRLFAAPPIRTARLVLKPLGVEDADEMAKVLADDRLHEFIGGRPATLTELRARYRRLAAGSPDPQQAWLNWVVRRRAGQAVGTVQATVTETGDRASALVAWVIGIDWQGHGYASEAACALVDWLKGRDLADVVAHIHPEHRASERVAARAGLRLTSELVDGERVWRLVS